MYRRIRDLREDADLTQAQMAEKLLCSRRTYCSYELGERNISADTLIRLADFHNTSIDYLLERTDAREPYPKAK